MVKWLCGKVADLAVEGPHSRPSSVVAALLYVLASLRPFTLAAPR